MYNIFPKRRLTVFQSDDAQPSVMSSDLPTGAYLLDVREPDEWAAGHAPDAVHIPVGALSQRAGEIPQDREIYVICRSGARSAYAAHSLAGAGWTTVNVADGMTGWAVAGRPMISETGTEPFVA
jgi:rhodanese-related sulfurtransferase